MATDSKYNHVIGLGICYHPDDRISYNALEVSNKSNTLSIEAEYQADNLDVLIKAIGKSYPIVAIIHGHGVLDKPILNLVPGETGISHKAIPGLNLDEYHTSEHSYPNSGWVSLTKREKVQDILSAFKRKGLSVIDLSIGITGLCPLIGILVLEEVVSIGDVQLLISQKVLDNISPVDSSIQAVSIDDRQLSSTFLPAYAAALNYFIDADCRIKDAITPLDDHRETYTYGQRSKKVLQLGLAAIMVLAMTNAYFFNDAYQLNERIAVTVKAQRPLLEKVNELKSQKDQLERAIGPINISKTQQAHFIDQIGASLEGSKIIIESINLYPMLSDRKEINAGDFQFDQSRIIVQGHSTDPRRFGDWVAEVREMDWVSSVEISPFKKNTEGKDEFLLVLGMKSNNRL